MVAPPAERESKRGERKTDKIRQHRGRTEAIAWRLRWVEYDVHGSKHLDEGLFLPIVCK
jgi:hypothetical protein